ncbi:hypothetical protein PITC_089190 [Penicillium italicum]|uniref:Chromosome segregation ATPase family protein n=1 Tax=Penicillium italicum TaxID=40296 RepID=A0A0A2LC71_PENIT|nr:hypothetical protein PITC_089190 [Penicillium italicum]
MPSPDKEAPRDRELVRHSMTHSESKVPMWDSSDPERAPPPLPMNPRSMSPMSPATRSNVSPNIQAVAAKFTERPSEHAPSSYTTNPMPLKSSSPERSLVKGQHHKRMQSLQPEDTRQDARSDFMNYLENRSPERPLRATIIEAAKPRDPSKSISSPALRQDSDREMTYSVSSRYLSKPILGESTPPSATMLALQNMQLPLDPDSPSPSKPPKLIAAPFEPQPHPRKNASMDSLSNQIHSLTDIASSLQREMMNLSRRSKDNATDLVSLKAATNARDEDIRKSLKDLSSHLKTKYLDTDATRFDFSNLFKGVDEPNPKDPDSPASKRSYSVPRMPSPNPFAFDRDSCVSPAPISDGSAALALLEKVLREMATKEGEQRLLELVEEIRSRPAPTGSDKDTDNKVTVMLEEILNLVKEDPSSKALVRSYGIAANLDNIQSGRASPESARSGSMRSVDGETVRALGLSNSDKEDGSSPNADEVLEILKSVKNSVVEGGGMTNGVKSLVRELRGEVLGMGRELGRRLDEIESTRANDEPEEQPRAAGPEEISAIVNRSLDDLKEQLAATINESRQQSSDLSEFRSTMNSAAIYSVVKKALDELELPQPQAESRGAEMDREDILETVREAWETYKPEIEFNNFGLERDEILTCLEEGLKSYQPQHEQAVTYDQVLAAVEDGMQKFIPPQIEHPPSISRDEIILTIRECLEKQPEPISKSLGEEDVGHLHSMRDEILDAVSKAMATHNEGSRSLDEEDINHLYSIRDEILDAVTGTMAANNSQPKSLDEDHVNHLYSVRDEIIEAVTGAVTNHAAVSKSVDEDHASHLTSLRDEILQAVARATEKNSTGSKELDEDNVQHMYSIRDEILEAITGTMAISSTGTRSLDEDHVNHLYSIRDEIIEAVTGAMASHSTSRSLEEDNVGQLNSIRDEILGALAGSMAQSTLSKDSYDSGLGRDEIVSAVSDGLEAHFTAAKEMEEPRISRHDVMNAVNEAFDAQQSALTLAHTNISRDEILNAIAEGIENSMNAQQSALSTNVQQTVSREEIFSSIVDAIEHSRTSLGNNGQPNISRDEILGAILEGIQDPSNRQEPNISREEILNAIADGIENSNNSSSRALTSPEQEGHDQQSPPSREEIFNAIVEGIEHSHASLGINGQPSVSKEDIMGAIAEGIEASTISQQSALSTNVQEPSISREEILDAIAEGIQNGNSITREIELNQDDLMQAITSGLNEAISTANTNVGGEMTERLQTLFDGMKEEFKQYSAADGRDTEQILDAIKDGLDIVRKEIETYVITAADLSGKDEVIDTVKEGFRLLHADMEKTITDTSLLNAPRGIPDTPELLDAMEKEFEHLRGTMTTLLLRNKATEDKDEILDAIREAADRHKNDAGDDVVNTIKHEFESLRERMEMSVVRAEPSDEKDEIISALHEHFDKLREDTSLKDGKENDMVNIMKQEFESLRERMEMSMVRAEPGDEKEEIISALREHFDKLREDTSLKDDKENDMVNIMKQEFENLRERMEMSVVRAEPSDEKDEIISALREHFDKLREDTSLKDDKENDMVNIMKQEFESLRERMEMSVVRTEPGDEKEEIISALREHFDKLREDTSLKDDKENDMVNIMKQEFENLRERMEMSVVRAEPSDEKDEIISALHEHFDKLREDTSLKDGKENDMVNIMKQEFESLRERLEMSVVRSEPGAERDEIISAMRENFDILREETSRRDGSESTLTATSELLDAFRDGVDSIREDLKKLLEKPTEFDSSEILDTIKDGLADVKLEMDSLRASNKELDDASTARGGELMLANEPSIGPDIDGLKVLITQLHDKVEAIEATPRVAETTEDALKRSHLDEVLLALHEVQLAMGEMSTQQSAANDDTARKQDTEILEQLLLSTKTQIDELVFPSPDQVATPEHIGALETIIREAKDSIAEFSSRVEAESPTKSEIGTLEGLIKDVWVILDEMKSKTKDVEEEEDPERLLKSDLQTVEAMIFEVKSQIDELKLPDVETLPTKTDIQELSTLVCDFREQMETNNELTAQGFDARKVEHGGLAEKIDEAKFVVGELGDELKSKLDGSTEGLTELKQLLEALAITAESFTTVDNIKELTDLINREFERSRGEEDAVKVEKEERDAATMVKHDEMRAAIILELGTKIDEKISEVLAKYEDAHTSLHLKFSEAEERDLAHTESLTSTRSLAEDIKLVIGAMGDSVNETCERLSVDTKALMEQVDQSRQQMENIHNDVKSHQEQSQAENERAAAATDRVENKLLEFHPRILESMQEILTIVNQHYDHSQKSAEDLKSELSALPSNIPAMLPALPPPEPERPLAIEDTPLNSKIDDLLEHVKNNKVHEVLSTLLDHSKNDQLHEKLDRALDQGSGSNDQINEKLDELLNNSTNGSGPVHEKLDALLSRPLNPPESDHSVDQMTKLDEMHRDIMENSRRMNEMFAAQSVLVAEDTERKRREAEEAAVALERRVSQREQVERELVGLHEEKDSMLNMIHRLRAEKEDLIKQNNKLSKDLSGLETALEIRHEEMRQMEDRADGLEKRILEGVLDHARTVLLGRSNGSQAMNLKRNRSTRSTRSSRTGARSPSVASTASTAKDPKDSRSLLGNGVGMALKRMPTSLQAGTVAVQPNIGKERRILSLSHVTGNRGVDRQVSTKSGITSLKRSHSVKSNTLRKTSWAGPTSVADKENQPFHEDDELASEAEDAGQQHNASYAASNTPTDRKTSYAGSNLGTETEHNSAPSNAGTDRRTSYAASNAGTERKTSYSGSIVDSVVTDATDQRCVSGVSSTNSYSVAESSIAERDHEDHHDDISVDGTESEDDAQTAREDGEHSGDEHQNEDLEMSRQIREANEAAEAEVLKLLAPSSDSGLGTDVAV